MGDSSSRAPRGGTVRLWDERGRLLTKSSVPGALREAALVGNQGRVVTLSRDDTVSIWDLSGRLLKTFRGHSGRATAIRVSPDAETLLTASEDTTAKLWPLADELAPECKTELSDVASVRFAPNGGDLLLIVTTHPGGEVKVWGRSGALRCTAADIHRHVKDAAFYRPGSAERTQYGVDW